MSKWLIGGVAAGIAASAVPAFFLGSARPELPGASVPEAHAQPAAGAAPGKGTFVIDEKMPFRSAKWKTKNLADQNREFEAWVEVSARRRLTREAAIDYVRIRVVRRLAFNSDDLIEILADDAAAVADFCESPMGALPPEAGKGEKALLARTLEVNGCFEKETLTLEYTPAKGEFTAMLVPTERVTDDAGLYVDRQKFTATIRTALKDFDTLKKYPAKR